LWAGGGGAVGQSVDVLCYDGNFKKGWYLLNLCEQKDVRGAHLFWMDGVWANVHEFQLCSMQKKVLMFGTAHVPVVDVVQFYAYLLGR
jgi:hypothetical protein